MSNEQDPDWYSANQRYLAAAIARVRHALEVHATKGPAPAQGAPAEAPAGAPAELEQALRTSAAALPGPAALDVLCERLGLSSFERATLLLCAGMELDGGFAAVCAKAQVDPERAYPTFGLALAALPEAHWSAVAPSGPLRGSLLVEVGPGNAITTSPLRIDEPILHYLTGVSSPDERLAGLCEPVRGPDALVGSHRTIADELVAVWTRTAGTPEFPVIQLSGREVSGKRAIAATVCERLGLNPVRAPVAMLPTAPAEVHRLLRLWSREAVLLSNALLLDCDEVDPGDAHRDGAVSLVVEGHRGPLFLTTRRRRVFADRPVLTVEVEKPTPAEQRDAWREFLGDAAAPAADDIERVVAQFDLGLPTIRAAYAGAAGRAAQRPARGNGTGDPGAAGGTGDSGAALGRALWHMCRTQARPRLDDLAERIREVVGWEDLVLPEDRLRTLRAVAAHVRERATVYERWGFGPRHARGLGISALFAGASGTGKTMAAAVLGNHLDLDLYRIDLSSVVSKYIGETEKNLARVFDAAEEGGAILLFDEADALFGKRSQIKDSHDRYANVETSYLLQRMESYRGLAILTTNMREALDVAFLRRLRFTVDFPFPEREQREAIWQGVFPPGAPTEGLDIRRLGRLSCTAGNIRNIALNAAFIAAEAGSPLRMEHLLEAARSEYEKIQKPMAESEVRDWS